MNPTEALLAQIMDVIAVRFDKRAVLRGGMVLRVLGCERLTNDVDYLFVPYASKKDVVEEVLAALANIETASIRHSMNSKCLRIVLTRDQVSVQIEIKTAADVPTQLVSNREMARQYGLPPRLLPVVDYPVALADKMAAWNERRLVRDVYDIFFYLRMGIRPDHAVLEKRLAKPVYSRLVRKADQFTGRTIEEFLSFLRANVEKLSDQTITVSLRDYLPEDELAGLSMRLRAELAKI